MDFSLRPVRGDECAAILEVYRRCEDFLALGPQAHASAEMVRQDLELSRHEGGQFCGIYAPGGEMIGVVDYVLQGFEGNPQHAFLSLLMIARGQRRHGLGRAVVATVEGEIRQRPEVTAILSAAQVNNPAAIHFWQREGYAIVSQPELQADGTTTVRLYKALG